MEWFLVFWVGSIVLAPLAASGRGRSVLLWLVLAVLLGPLALLAVLVLGQAGTRAAATGDGTYACPFCAERVLLEARICKHCHSKLREDDGTLVSPP